MLRALRNGLALVLSGLALLSIGADGDLDGRPIRLSRVETALRSVTTVDNPGVDAPRETVAATATDPALRTPATIGRPTNGPGMAGIDVPVVEPWLPKRGIGRFDFGSSSSTSDSSGADSPREVLFGEGSPTLTFNVAIEEGIPLNHAAVVAEIDAILGDPRSWIGDGRTSMRRVEGTAPLTIAIATPATVDRMCRPLRTNGWLSCSAHGWIALNLHRWVLAVDHWTGSIADYRTYLVNHEIGHQLNRGHRPCPGPGERAPIMMQQTKSLSGCEPNGWVYPDADPEVPRAAG